MRRIFQRIRRMFYSISTKVILFIIILVLPLNLIAIMETNSVMNTLIEQARFSSQSYSDAFMVQIGSRMANTQSLLYYFLTDQDFIRMKLQTETTYQYQSAKNKVFNSLVNMAGMTDGGDGYFYHMENQNDTLIYDSNPSQSGKNFGTIIEDFVSDKPTGRSRIGWHLYSSGSHRYLFFIAKIKGVAYGGWINIEPLFAEVKKNLPYNDYLVDFKEEKMEGTEKRRVIISSSVKSIYLNISLSRNEIVGKVSGYQKLLQTMVFLYLALIPVLYALLRYLLIRPLKRINYAHRQLQKGNQDFRITEKGNSVEYQAAYLSFNQMADNLKTLKLESYEKEISKQKMELRNLQLQIRPHFLLNTFNLIYTLAQRKKMNAVQEIILYLSDYFRYIFRHERDLELFQKELKLVEGYLKMVSIRYPGKIDVKYEFDPEINHVRLPPLLLHNFIENAVKYGIKQEEPLCISITGIYRNKLVTFHIIDNGSGMDTATQEKSRKLLKGEFEPENPNSHVGLLNSIKRLKYFYGEQARIEIDSVQGKMTSVRIQFPYNLDGMGAHDESTYDK